MDSDPRLPRANEKVPSALVWILGLSVVALLASLVWWFSPNSPQGTPTGLDTYSVTATESASAEAASSDGMLSPELREIRDALVGNGKVVHYLVVERYQVTEDSEEASWSVEVWVDPTKRLVRTQVLRSTEDLLYLQLCGNDRWLILQEERDGSEVEGGPAEPFEVFWTDGYKWWDTLRRAFEDGTAREIAPDTAAMSGERTVAAGTVDDRGNEWELRVSLETSSLRPVAGAEILLGSQDGRPTRVFEIARWELEDPGAVPAGTFTLDPDVMRQSREIQHYLIGEIRGFDEFDVWWLGETFEGRGLETGMAGGSADEAEGTERVFFSYRRDPDSDPLGRVSVQYSGRPPTALQPGDTGFSVVSGPGAGASPRDVASRAGLGAPVRQEVDGREYWEVDNQIVTEHGVYEGVLATLRLGDVIVSVSAPDSAAVRRAVSALQRVN